MLTNAGNKKIIITIFARKINGRKRIHRHDKGFIILVDDFNAKIGREVVYTPIVENAAG